jgi:tRNA A37 threonylcarbamoyladenosine dehydratase
MNSDYLDRFAGIGRLYGTDALEKFHTAHVAVVGLGGVGSWVVEALARSGIGELTLIDLDEICVSNTNRQMHAVSSNLGASKVQTMADRARDINPELIIHEHECFATQDNLEDLLVEPIDYVVDAIDSAGVKAAMISHCRRRKIPIVTTGGAGGLIDPLKIEVADLSKTQHDALAAKVRSILKRHFGFSRSGKRFGVECVFSQEQARYPQLDGSVCATKNFGESDVRLDCSGGLGAVTSVTAAFANVAVSRVLIKMSERVTRERKQADQSRV